MDDKFKLILAVSLPIVFITSFALYKSYQLTTGREIVLPISGYDPRNLLSGHYLIYTVDYGIKNICHPSSAIKKNGYLCLNPKEFSYKKPKHCPLFIKGTCEYRRFDAGINRYYVSEGEAKDLNRFVIDGAGSLLLSVQSDGETQIKDLLINDVSWRDTVGADTLKR